MKSTQTTQAPEILQHRIVDPVATENIVEAFQQLDRVAVVDPGLGRGVSLGGPIWCPRCASIPYNGCAGRAPHTPA
jgi:hypothetical protein